MRPGSTEEVQDVMQVCLNGHVITDLLRAHPERGLAHCDRCGAATIDHRLTWGRDLPGAIAALPLQPIGTRPLPRYCSMCGAAFPWTAPPRPPGTEPLGVLETLLGRLPRAIRQLRTRHGDRPPFRIVDVYDLEDLLRALLPLHFDDVHPECRTPRYAPATRTDFLLAREGIAVAAKLASGDPPQLAEQFHEDAAYYRRERKCRTLVVFVHDPELRVREPQLLQAACTGLADELDVRCVVGGVVD